MAQGDAPGYRALGRSRPAWSSVSSHSRGYPRAIRDIARRARPPHPAPQTVTIASRPSQWDGMNENIILDAYPVKRRRKYSLLYCRTTFVITNGALELPWIFCPHQKFIGGLDEKRHGHA